MLKIQPFEFNPFGELTYIVYNPATLDAIIVDPGMGDQDENEALDSFIEDKKLKITGVVNTHMHLDHCFGANYVKDKYGVGVSAHTADQFLGEDIDNQARLFGIRLKNRSVMIDAPLADGDTIEIGDESLRVIHTPGHSPGGICLYSSSGSFLIAGDTLFKGSIGRTDLPGSDHAQLLHSIRTKLFTLPDATIVLSGHGEPTTIGEEKAHNPYV